jgi:hypothetical protein
MASRRMGTIISKNPIPSRPCQVLYGLSRQARDRKGTGVLKSFERGHTEEKKRSPAPWIPSQTYSRLEPELSAKRCPAVRWCTTGLQGPGEISTLLFAVNFSPAK